MLTIRRAAERGHADHGWLDSRHTFSFADYRDPRFMGFGALRVINEDTVAGGGGFPPHRHRDMEIVSYVLDGALRHEDDLGNGGVIRPGDVQRMSAGTGVTHSEYNASEVEPVHFLQIWILPRRAGLPSGYEQKRFDDDEKRARLRLVASPDGEGGSVTLQQDARMFAALLAPGESVTHRFAGRRKGWLQVARGAVAIGGHALHHGAGVAIADEEAITLQGGEGADGPAEVILFDLAP